MNNLDKKETLKSYHIASKTIWQIFLLLLETVGISSLAVCFSQKIVPFENIIDVLERFVLFYSFYQIVMFVILNSINDIKHDMYIELKDVCALALLYRQNKSESLLQHISHILNEQLDTGRFNSLKVRQEYREILPLIKNNDTAEIEKRMIIAEHYMNLESLAWRYSFFLRVFK